MEFLIVNETDEVELKRMLGGVTALPSAVVEVYLRRRGFRNLGSGGTGSMSVDALVQILVECGLFPTTRREIQNNEETWRGYKDGDAVELKVDVAGKPEWIPGQFVRVVAMAQVEVRRRGDARVYRMKAFEVRSVVKEEVIITDENAEAVTVFHEGKWVEGTVRKHRADKNVEVMLPNDTKQYRLFKPDAVRAPELASA